MECHTQGGKFFKAVRAGDLCGVRSMSGADASLLRSTDAQCFGTTALMHAVSAEDRAMVDLLLDLGAPIDQRSDWWAGSFGVLDSASDVMAAHLLQRGATLTPHAAAKLGMIEHLRAMIAKDPSVVHARGGDGQLPLHFARTPEIADLLLQHGAVIDATDIDHGSTAAQWLGESRSETAAHLVKRGAAPDPFLAARIGDTALLETLLKTERDGVNVRVSRERFPVPAPAAGHIYLYTIGEGCSLLHAAAGAEQAGVIRWLGERGADMNPRGGYDDGTPLHSAAWRNKAEAIGALLDAGAEINVLSGAMHDNEPIGWAIVSGAVEAFRVLLDRGALVRPVHVQDALKGAAGAFREVQSRRPIESWTEIARILLARGSERR